MSPVEKPTQADREAAIDVKAEYAAFTSWWGRTVRGKPIPTSASHFFDTWLGSARHRLAADQAARTTTNDGYVAAFYHLGKLLGINARAASPSHVWINEMLPKLMELTAARTTTTEGEEVTTVTITVRSDQDVSFHSSIPHGQDWQTTRRAMQVALTEFERQFAESDKCPVKPAILATPPATPAGGGEPFGYWVEQKGAEPALLRRPAYIPEPSDLRKVTPLFAAPSPDAAPAREADSDLIGLEEAARDLLDLYRTDQRTVGYRKDRWDCLASVLGQRL